jgi:hypothetical protein
MAVSFTTTYTQFVDDLKGTFPEFASTLDAAACDEAFFTRIWKSHTKDVAEQNAAVFAGEGIELVPGFRMTEALWKEISSSTQTVIWKYLSSLLLLTAVSDGADWDLSGFNADMEEMMRKLRDGEPTMGMGEEMGNLFQKFAKMAESFGFKDVSGAEAPKFKIPERLFKGHIAKIAEELIHEFKPEDFGISAEMLETKDPARIFQFLQEIFTKKPELMMSAAQKIAKKIQAKFQRGEIRREDIIREAEELMKEFSDNDAFSNLFGSIGEMFKDSDKESGNEGSARRREVQERLRRKAAEKKTATAETNTIVPAGAEAAALASMAALLREEDEEKKSKTVPKKGRK